MRKKIYVVKRGRETGIFDDWKRQCEPQIDGFSGALFCGIEYRTEFVDADAAQKGSLRRAFLLAEQYMNDLRVGGFRLVYQGENKDYAQEESWKQEGYLPFGQAASDAAEKPQQEANPGVPEDSADADDADTDGSDADGADTGDGKDESDGAEGADADSDFVYIEDDDDDAFSFLSHSHDEAQEADEEEQEAILREAQRDDADHMMAEEIYGKLHVPTRPNLNEPWVEILLYITGCRGAYSSGYIGRYHVPVLYTVLVAFVFQPSAVLDKFLEIYKEEILPEIKMAERPKIAPMEWVREACSIWENSDECRDLRERFAKNGMEELDFDELWQRCINLLAASDGTRESGFTTYMRMKKYIKKGGHSLSDLYQEMTENAVYRPELAKMSGPYVNPDLEQKLPSKETKLSFKQLAMQAEAIGLKLKERVIGQDDAVNKLENAFFHAEKKARQDEKRRGPRSVFLFAGPSGVGKTFTAQLFAEELGLPFRRFDMSGYPMSDSVDELVGISTFWSRSKAGVLTSYVKDNPHCVLLFDEIEKAHSTVIRMFLPILDEGICFDRHDDTDISFEDAIIIFTTNAGKQLYRDAQGENLTALPDKVVLDALEKDIHPETKNPFFPPEILSRMSAHTVIMFNHLRADALRRVVEKDVEKQLLQTEQKFGYSLTTGEKELARTVLYSMGGSADARNASQLAGKLIDQQLQEFMYLMMQKLLPDNIERLKQIEWGCDFTGAGEEIEVLYSGEKNCVIPVLGTMPYTPSGSLQENGVAVKGTTDPDVFLNMLRKERVLFAVVDYTLGLEHAEGSLNIADMRTAGGEAFLHAAAEYPELPLYILCGGAAEYPYSDREKGDLFKRGAQGFINRAYCENELEAAYWDACCQKVMDMLARRHQVLTYRTRKRVVGERHDVGKIEFYDLKLETAVESEDAASILSNAERPKTKFDDVIGAEKAKEELRYFVKYLTNPSAFLQSGVRPPKGILLYGDPGTGKTLLARAMAGESDVVFLQTSAAGLKNRYVGESEANIKRLFAQAKKYAPAILFIDEIDAIGKKRTGSEAAHTTEGMLNALLTEMDGFCGADSSRPIFVLAATNHVEQLDDALLRRFDNKIHVDLPNESEREQYLLLLLAGRGLTTVSKEAVHSVAERTTGQSLAELQNVFELAFRNAARQSRTMTDDDLLTALEEYWYGEKKEYTPDYYKSVAIHEAGHAYISYLGGDKPSYVTIESRGDFGGYMQHANQEEVGSYTKEELLARIRTSLAGRAAEEVFFGREQSLNTGASSDLRQATNFAFRILCVYGMEDGQLVILSREEVLRSALAAEYIAKVNEILKREMQNTAQMIENAKDKVQKIADALLKENRLTGKQLEALILADGEGTEG